MSARVKVEVLERELSRASDLSVFLLHGRKDRAVPYRFSERSLRALAAAGFEVRHKAYDCGHHVTPEQVRDVRTWLRELLGLR